MNLLSILLQAQPGMGSMLPMILIFGAFFIYMIWSQKKQEKKIRQYRANLKAGDSKARLKADEKTEDKG